jgi:hypothetical protein
VPLCAYGAEPNPDAPPYVWVTWIDAKAWLSSLWLPLAWAAAAAKAIMHDTAVFCATEPPQPVAPDNATIVAASHDPIAFEKLVQYIEQSAGWWVWHNVCRCKANPDSSCVDYSFSGWGITWTNATAVGLNLEFGTPFTATTDLAITGIAGFSRPSGDLTARDLHLWDGAGTALAIQNGFPTPAGTWHWIFTEPLLMAAGQTWTVSETVLSGSTVAQIAIADGAFPSNGFFTWGTPRYNNGTNVRPTTEGGSQQMALMPIACATDSAPYAPDPPPTPAPGLPDYPLITCEEGDICILLQQLRAELTQQKTLITLIQRQAVPFAYIVGTVHSGLTGNGTFNVAGILGLLVQVSTVPAAWGISADNPQRYIPAPAMVAPGDSAGDQDTHFVHFSEELWFPTAMGAMTHVRYEFKPGCGGAITELVREP